MTEPRDDAGRFEGPALYGRAHDEKAAGYKPMPDDAGPKDTDLANAKEAADELTKGSAKEEKQAFVRTYQDTESGEGADKNEAISLDRAARDLASARASESDTAEKEAADKVRKEADKLKAETRKAEQPKAEPVDDGVAPKSDAGSSDLDPVVQEALKHPQVRQAIEEQLSAAERERQSYSDGLKGAADVVRMTFMDQFPDLSVLPADRLPAALEAMSEQDPERFAKVRAMVERAQNLETQQKDQEQRQAAVARQKFDTYAKAEDARFDKIRSSDSPATQNEVAKEIVAIAAEHGLDKAQFLGLFNTEPVMRNSAFQSMMYDAAKYRMAQKTKTTAAARPLPPVQRPGTTSGERSNDQIRSLSSKFTSNPNLKNAAEMLAASRRSARKG